MNIHAMCNFCFSSTCHIPDEEDEEFDEAEEEQAMGNGSEGMEVETGLEEVKKSRAQLIGFAEILWEVCIPA